MIQSYSSIGYYYFAFYSVEYYLFKYYNTHWCCHNGRRLALKREGNIALLVHTKEGDADGYI